MRCSPKPPRACRSRSAVSRGAASLRPPAPASTRLVGEILARLAAVTELELLRSSETLRPTDRAQRELLTDLLSGRASSASHVLQRAEVLGLRLVPDEARPLSRW